MIVRSPMTETYADSMNTAPEEHPAPAEDVAFDHLQILLDALESRGLDYAPVAVTTNDDLELPAFTTPGVLQDVRLTDRDVILVRTDVPTSQMKWSNPQQENFQQNLPHPIIPFLDGWNSVKSVSRCGRSSFAATICRVNVTRGVIGLTEDPVGFSPTSVSAGSACHASTEQTWCNTA